MRIKNTITGLFICLGLLIAAPTAHAIYSPKIVEFIGPISQHIFQARQINNTGSVRNGITRLFDNETIRMLNEENDRLRAQHKATGTGELQGYINKFKTDVAGDEFGNFAETFALLFNYLPAQEYIDQNNAEKEKPGEFINSCLRNDILALQDMRDTILNEALVSSAKVNRQSATILWGDYKDIRAVIELLKVRYGDSAPANLFFNSGETNYYLYDNCPEGGFWGEYSQAFQDLKRSGDVLWTAMSGQGLGQSSSNAQWGSIKEMAIARSKVRATEWIRSNQLSLTIGEPEGGSSTSIASLIRKEGLGGVANFFKTQLAIAKSLLPITLLFDPASKGINQLTVLYDALAAARRQGAEFAQAETAIKFNLEFSTLADANTAQLEKTLTLINAEIRRGTEQFGENGGQSLPTLCQQVRNILIQHCPNQGGDIPSC